MQTTTQIPGYTGYKPQVDTYQGPAVQREGGAEIPGTDNI